jgi:hypothetical protein
MIKIENVYVLKEIKDWGKESSEQQNWILNTQQKKRVFWIIDQI